jgi:hypothetical protein
MADLNVNKSDNITIHEDAGQNPVPNNSFESAPTFTAATNVSSRWIDGTAAGSTTSDTFKWSTSTITGTCSAQFDSSQFNSGSQSLKISTLATASRIFCIHTRVTSAPTLFQYAITVQPSQAYKLTYYMKTTANSGSSSGARIQVVEYNSAGTAGTTTSGTSISTTTGWTQYTINFTTASTANYVLIEPIIIGDTGLATLIMDAWFDDIVLQFDLYLA